MAYQSQVSNKRWYDTFAGTPATSKKTELSFLVKTLEEDLYPAAVAAGGMYIDKKVEDAEAKMEELRTKYEPEQIEAILMEGSIPELSNQYAQKVVEGQHGRIMASKVIKEIEKNKHLYNPDTQSLHEFYKPYMQDLSGKSNSFTTGFAGIFTQYSTEEAIKDAELRSAMSANRKIDNMSDVINVATNAEDAFALAMSHTFKVNGVDQYATNKEVNESILNLANMILLDEVPIEKVEFAIELLEYDRGLGTGGNKIGSLLNTAIDNPSNQYIAKLHGDLIRKKEAMLKDAESARTKQKTEEVNNIFAEALKLQVAGELTSVKYAELELKLINTDASQLLNFQSLTSSTYVGKAPPDIVNEFINSAVKGSYANETEVIAKALEIGIPKEQYIKAIDLNNAALNLRKNGLDLIWNTNFEYKEIYQGILDKIDALNIANEAAGSILDDAELKRYIAAKEYFENAVLFQENLWLQEGYQPKPLERRNYGKDIIEYIETRVSGEKQVGETKDIAVREDVDEDGTFETVIKPSNLTEAFFDEQDYAFPEIVEQRQNMISNFTNADFSQLKPLTGVPNEDSENFAHNVGVINDILGDTYINLLDSPEGQSVLMGLNQFANDILTNLDDATVINMFKGLGLVGDDYTPEDLNAARKEFFSYFTRAITSLKSPTVNE